jgi:pilus assembly protein Flp/PilA
MRRFNVFAESQRLFQSQDGATAIEYALIAAGIAGAIIIAVGALGDKLVIMWSSVAAIFS